MILPLELDRIPQALGGWLARRRAWNPVGERVLLEVNESGDPELFGKKIAAVIRATARDQQGNLTKALLELDDEIDYAGHYGRRGIRRVVTTPYLRWHGLTRLLVSSSAVRVIDADAFEDEAYDRIIALASMRIIASN